MKKRINVRRLLIISILMLTIGAITIAIIQSFSPDKTLEMIVSLVAIFSGISGLVFGLMSLHTANLDNVREFFSTGDQAHIVYARSVLYEYGKYKLRTGKTYRDPEFGFELIDMNQKTKVVSQVDIEAATSTISNFFHLWGLLTQKGYLPMWVFESSTGISVYRLYQAADDVILERRKGNPLYAQKFEWLYSAISKKYEKEIELYKSALNTHILKK